MRVFNLFKGAVFHQYYPRVIMIFRIFGYSGNDFLKFGNAGYYHFLLTTFGKNFLNVFQLVFHGKLGVVRVLFTQ